MSSADTPSVSKETTRKPADGQARQGRDLNDAIEGVFAAQLGVTPFADRFCELAFVLTNAPSVSLWQISDDEETPAQMLSAQGNPVDAEVMTQLLGQENEKLAGNRAATVLESGYFIANIAQPNGTIAKLAAALPHGGTGALGLAYERISLLSQLSFSHHRNAEIMDQAALARTAKAVAANDPEGLQTLADALAKTSNADYAAAGLWQAGRLQTLAISGQVGGAKRAQLPSQLNSRLTETARLNMSLPNRLFARAPNKDSGLAMILEKPRRAPDVLGLAGAFFAQADHGRAPRRWSWLRAFKWLVAIGLLIGIGLIPIPDGAQVSATVEPVNRRIVTAPLNTTLTALDVEDGDVVKQGAPLVRLDVQDIELDMIALKAERTSAILDQETARAANNAAALRNAELEVERLASRIALLEYQMQFSTLNAPISGVVIFGDLDGRSGATVRTGQDLLEISDPSAVYLKLAIREEEIGKLTSGDTGLFRPDFDPSLRIPVQVGAISPALDLSGPLPIALADAEFVDAAQNLRPGVRGVVLIGDTERPIWNVFYTALRDWVLLRFWI